MTTLTAPADNQAALLPDYPRFIHLPPCSCSVCGQDRGCCSCNADVCEFLENDWEEYIYLAYRGLLGQILLEQKQSKARYLRIEAILNAPLETPLSEILAG